MLVTRAGPGLGKIKKDQQNSNQAITPSRSGIGLASAKYGVDRIIGTECRAALTGEKQPRDEVRTIENRYLQGWQQKLRGRHDSIIEAS